MKKQLLCIILTLALLFSALSVGMVLPAAAAEVTVTEITPSANTDKVIAAEDNILAAATCSVSNLTDAKLYDGKIENNTINMKDTTKTHMWVTYTLAAPSDVDAVLIAGSTATRDGGLGMQGFAVYVGDKDAAAIEADSTVQPVYETADRVYNGARVDFATPIRATYIVFKIGLHEGGWAGNMWVSEIAATGTAPYSVVNITGSSNVDKVIAAEDNILLSANCSESNLTPTAAPGVYNGVVDDNKWNRKEAYIEGADGDYMWVTYALAADTKVDSVLIGGSGANRNGLGLGFTGYSVYIGDKDAAAIKADSSIQPAYTTADQIQNARLVEFTEAVRGTYIVFKLGIHRDTAWNGNVWISEIAATGTIPYSVTNITDLNVASPIAAEDNLLASATVTEPYMRGANGAKLFNGIINEAGNTWDVQSKYFNKVVDGYMWVTFTLPAQSSIDELVISGAAESGASGPLGFDGVDVYIGDMDHNAILASASAQPVYSHHAFVRETLHVKFAQAVVGTKIVFKMGIMGTLKADSYKDRIRLSELAAGGAVVESKNVVCIGDSITWGCTAASAGAQVETPYPAHLQSMLNAQNPSVQYTVTNLGSSGAAVVDGSLLATTDNVRSWLNAKWVGNTANQEKVAAADYVFIMLGTNDTVNWENGRRDLYKQEYKKLIDTIKSVNEDVAIYIVTSPAALKETYYSTLATDIIPMQLQLAAELGLPVADAYNATRDYIRDEGEAAFIVSTEIDGLRIHPDSEGLGVIAGACVEALAGNDHVSELYSSATADADASGNFEGVTGGVPALGAHDANRVTPLRHNLLGAAGVKITGVDSPAQLADGKLRFVNTTAQNHATGAEVTVDFGNVTTITQLLLGGCQVAADKADYLYPALDVYVTNDLDALGEAVYSITDADKDGNVAGRIVTLNEAATGRYMVVKVQQKAAPGATSAWLGELAAVGYRSNLVSVGGQVRNTDADGKAALRFGFDLMAEGVAYANADPVTNNNYARDLSGATYTVDGVAYPLVDFGTVLSLDGTSGLTLDEVDGANVKQVPAANLYNVDGERIRYTAVVVGIPAGHLDTPVYARSYVTYEVNGQQVTVYGDSISRTVNQCASDSIN